MIKALTVGIFSLLLFFASLFSPSETARWISEGYCRVIEGILPSLFLPMVLTSFVFLSPLRQKLEKLFSIPCRILFGTDPLRSAVILFGLLCGFPMGITLAAESAKQKQLTPKEYHALCLVANNCGVGFLFHYIGSRLGQDKAFILFLSQLCSCALLCRIFLRGSQGPKASSQIPCAGYAAAFSEAIKKTVISLSYVAGFVIFFTLLGRMSEALTRRCFAEFPLLPSAIYAVLELSSGAAALLAQDAPLPLTALSVGWGGICVWLQSKAAAGDLPLPRHYLSVRLLHAVLCCIFCFVFSHFLL